MTLITSNIIECLWIKIKLSREIIFKLEFLLIYLARLCTCVCDMYLCECGGQKTNCRSQFFYSTVWVLKIPAQIIKHGGKHFYLLSNLIVSGVNLHNQVVNIHLKTLTSTQDFVFYNKTRDFFHIMKQDKNDYYHYSILFQFNILI